MTVYCVDDGGDGTQTNTTQSTSTLDWSKADTSIANLIAYDAAAFTTAGNIIFIGDDHVDPDKAAHWTLTLPSSGAPVQIISADRTQSTPTYKAGSSAQLSSLGGAYNMTLDGSGAFYGIKAVAGSGSTQILWSLDADEVGYADSATFTPTANSYISFSTSSSNGRAIVKNCVIDLTADGTSPRNSYAVSAAGWSVEFIGLTFVNAGYRTGTVFNLLTTTYNSQTTISGCDFSGFTNATLCEILTGNPGGIVALSNCITAATWAPFAAGTPAQGGEIWVTNCGPADDPSYLAVHTFFGDIVSTTSIYRSSGATVEEANTAWLVTTTANCVENAAFRSPWMYGTVSSTGSKTFDCYIVNDTADFTDAEVWLEVEYLGTTDEANTALASNHRTVPAAAAAQTDDTSSTWNGTGPSFTYKQKLSVSATVNETGIYRARVLVGVTSIASSRYFYIDPKITVS